MLLDVDGVIHDMEMLIAVQMSADRAAIADRLELDIISSHGYRLAIPRYMPELIQSLAAECEIWWCTTWRRRANDDIAPHLGVGPFPAIDDGTRSTGTEWKVSAAATIVADAQSEERPVVWIEDFHGDLPDLGHVAFVDTGPQGRLRWSDLDIPELVGSPAGTI